MFSPPANAVSQAASTRSSRRRQRPLSSEGSVSQPKAKRQRSALSEQTFVAPDAPPEMQEIKATRVGGTISRRENTRSAQTPRRELAVRGKKPKLADRGSKNDGSVVLVRYLRGRYWLSLNSY
jgi:nuclear pore complex protein Nup133